jgi:ribosome biogenesis GTPase
MGWSAHWANALAGLELSEGEPARVIQEHREAYILSTEKGEFPAEVSGRFRHQSLSRRDFPAVGDWVIMTQHDAASPCIIQTVLPRRSAFLRRAAGVKSEEQVVAANVDTALLVSGLDQDFNPRRIERYLTLSYESGAAPIILLNKADLCPDLDAALLRVEQVACGVPIHALSAVEGEGLDTIRKHLQPGTTGVLLGSSGVGKSTLLNALLGVNQAKTAPVRADDDKGRHTTTHRELIPLPDGALLIDTPGMRELQLLADETSVATSFDDVAEYTGACRFSDCSHTGEPGCAVQAALEEGSLEPARYESYLQQRKEAAHHQREQDVHLQKEERKRWQAIHRSMRHHHKRQRRG